jgi:predicted PurR-regulated permease PerM
VGTLKEINSYLIAFFRGQMLVSCIDGLLVGIALTIFGLPYALLIGVFVALLGLLPYVGNLLCWIPAVLISLAHFSVPENQQAWLGSMSSNIWIYPVIVSVIFVGVQQVNSFVTAPKIVGDSVGLHPMTVIFSVFFWTLLLGGALGTLLAVPLSASVKVLFRRYIWERKLNEAPPPAPGKSEPDAALAPADVAAPESGPADGA